MEDRDVQKHNRAKRLVMRTEFRSRREEADKGRKSYSRPKDKRAWKRDLDALPA